MNEAAGISPFRKPPRWQRWLEGSAGLVSVGVHVVLLLLIVATPTVARKAEEWVSVTINEPPPPPPPPPPELPRPEPPKPKPTQAVEFEKTVEAPPTPPVEAPPSTAKPMVLKQGLSSSSFATGGVSTGLSVSQGNTTAVAATKGGPVDGPYATVPFSAAATPPRLRFRPTMEVPDAARAAEVEGVIEVRIDLDDKGRPVKVTVVRGLGYGTDEACQAAWMRSSWKPAESVAGPVAVTGIPQQCTVIATRG